MNTYEQLSNKSYLAGGYIAKGDIYCPSCNKVCSTLKLFIHHALNRHGKIYRSTPKGDNYELKI
jgi:hypothetical protein